VPASASRSLSVELRDAVALVTLNRPDKRNALSIELRFAVAEEFARLSASDDVACVVLTGAGSAFCAGMDVTQFGGDEDNRRQLYESSVACFRAVGSCAKPVIAALNGPAVAGGFALALLCDVRLASSNAVVGFLETRRGIPASYASARRALPAALAIELSLSGRVLDAREALALGIVSAVHDGEELLDRALEYAAGLASQPRWMLLETKRRILLDAEASVGALAAQEDRALRGALLTPRVDPAA